MFVTTIDEQLLNCICAHAEGTMTSFVYFEMGPASPQQRRHLNKARFKRSFAPGASQVRSCSRLCVGICSLAFGQHADPNQKCLLYKVFVMTGLSQIFQSVFDGRCLQTW